MILDPDAIKAEFLNQCGPCEFGVGRECTCPKRDYRPTMSELVREVERQRKLIEILRETCAQVDALATFEELSAGRVAVLMERMTEQCDLLAEVEG